MGMCTHTSMYIFICVCVCEYTQCSNAVGLYNAIVDQQPIALAHK